MKFLRYLLAITFIFLSISGVRADDTNLGVNVFSSSSGQAPSNVTNFKADPGDTQIKLSWDNPTTNFLGVKIQRKTDYYPASATDGDNIYDGSGSSFTDTGLINGVRYYYTAFAYNKPGNYASGAIASAIPWVSQLQETPAEDLPILPETKTKEKTQETTTPGAIAKKGEIEFSDFEFFSKQDLGWVKVSFLERNHFFVDEELLISISKDVFQKEVSVIIFTFGSSSYLLTEKDGNYQAIFKTPKIKGDYNMTLNIVFKDSTIRSLSKEALVDPYGYIYKKSKSLTTIFNKEVFEETRVLGAKVTLYFYSDEKKQWILWDGEKYKQKNPQETNQSGDYGFMVPAGKYYLEVQKSGYRFLKTDQFEVKDQIINKNLELQPVISNTMIVIFVILGILGLGGLIIWLIRRRR